MHQSFVSKFPTSMVSTPPTPTGIAKGIAGLRCRAITFLLNPQCRGFNIGNLTPLRFSVVSGEAKSRVVTISLSQQDGAYSRALKSEESLPVGVCVGGGGAGSEYKCLVH